MIYTLTHRQLQPAMGMMLLVWQEHDPDQGLFETLARGTSGYLRPNPRRYGYTWRIYPDQSGDYLFEGSEGEYQVLLEWLVTESSPYSF